MTPKKNQSALSTYKSETHQQISNQAAQEPHATCGPSNKGHPAGLSTSQTHAIATLWVRKPWRQRQKQYQERWQLEGEEAKDRHLQDPQVTTKTLTESATSSTSLLDEHLGLLVDLETLADLEAQEDQGYPSYPPTISYPSLRLET